VITGYNTDIEFDGVTYHIQTEDKGLKTPVIISLVYNGGTILASKRVPYDDLLVDGLNEEALSARLQKLHKTICAAIKKGRIDDLRQMTYQSGKRVRERDRVAAGGDIAVRDSVQHAANGTADVSLKTHEEPDPIEALRELLPFDEPLIEAVAVCDEMPIVPHEAVTIVSDLAGTERPGNTKLSVDLIGDSEFYGGQERMVGVMVCRGSERKVVAGAEVMIKVVGSSFRPLVFHSLTDKNGISMVSLQIPHFRSGRATMILRAMNKGEEVEVRRAVTHG
jgi:hypothetical protein